MALVGNAHIFTKVNVPKYLFLLSKNVQTLVNFLLTLLVFFLFCALDGIAFSWRFLALIYPISLLLLFPFMLATMKGFMERLVDRIISLG